MAMHPYQDKGAPVSGGMRPRIYHPHSWPGTSEVRVRFAARPSYGVTQRTTAVATRAEKVAHAPIPGSGIGSCRLDAWSMLMTSKPGHSFVTGYAPP